MSLVNDIDRTDLKTHFKTYAGSGEVAFLFLTSDPFITTTMQTADGPVKINAIVANEFNKKNIKRPTQVDEIYNKGYLILLKMSETDFSIYLRKNTCEELCKIPFFKNINEIVVQRDSKYYLVSDKRQKEGKSVSLAFSPMPDDEYDQITKDNKDLGNRISNSGCVIL